MTFKEEIKPNWKPLLLKTFNDYSSELVQHIDQEEADLFPYIESLMAAQESKKLDFTYRNKLKLINHLLNHNDNAEEKLEILIDFLEKRKTDFDNPMRLNMLLTKLNIFKDDLLIHAKIEDQVLLPKALELEQEILNNPDLIS